jgi:hypothetical protein
MRLLLIILFFTICFNNVNASPQSPDYLIVGKDTFAIYFLPLNKLDTTKQKEFFYNLNLSDSDKSISFNLWRGYQAFWKLEDDKLYLLGLKGCSNSDRILESTFANSYMNGKVFANWFSSYLAIAKDKILKWDGVFSRTYFKEDILEFKNGVLTNRKQVNNYIQLEKGISRLNNKIITDTIFYKINQLNWEKLSKCECDDQYVITINEKGKIGEISIVPLLKTKKENDEYASEQKICIKKFKKILKDLQFNIITWNGKPYQEKFIIEIFYTVDNKLENWTR